MRALYHAVENLVKRAVKILFRDLLNKINQNAYVSKAYFETRSNTQIFFDFHQRVRRAGL